MYGSYSAELLNAYQRRPMYRENWMMYQRNFRYHKPDQVHHPFVFDIEGWKDGERIPEGGGEKIVDNRDWYYYKKYGKCPLAIILYLQKRYNDILNRIMHHREISNCQAKS